MVMSTTHSNQIFAKCLVLQSSVASLLSSQGSGLSRGEIYFAAAFLMLDNDYIQAKYHELELKLYGKAEFA